jgi:hypothetical protein
MGKSKTDKFNRYGDCYNSLISYLPKEVALPDIRELTTGISIMNEYFSENEMQIIKQYCTEGKTLESIGEGFNISRERVRQKKDGILRKLPWVLLYQSVKNYREDLEKNRMSYGVEKMVKLEYGFAKKAVNIPIEALCLSSKTYNLLKKANVKKLGDMVTEDYHAIFCPKMGHCSRMELRHSMLNYGFAI